VTEAMEGAAERERRRYQRRLFDTVAPLYAATRPGYPPELASCIVDTAGAEAGDPVLEVGCGTGQLTSALTPFGFALTAIDVGASLIELAQDRVAGVAFRAVSFEEFDAGPGTFSLVVSGAAFHWIDPEVRFVKAARLLRPGGWLAVAGYEEQYDEPLGSAVERMWRARASDDGAWLTRPADGDAISGSGAFGRPAHRAFTRRITRSAEDVIGVENTRATSLSWPPQVRRAFNAELRERLPAAVGVTVTSSVTMAPVLAAAAGA
jgi:SAM-dependent methyltransferase